MTYPVPLATLHTTTHRPDECFMKSPAGLLLSAIELDRASAIPLYRQLYLQIRKQILGGRIQGGVRLPSTRTLSKELALSRITILNAFDQLIAEGFLASRTGAGTYVGTEWEHRTAVDDGQARQPPRLSDLSQSMLSLRSDHFRGVSYAVWDPATPTSFRSAMYLTTLSVSPMEDESSAAMYSGA